VKALVSQFVRFKIWADILMISLILFGLFSLFNIRSSYFPETPTDRISVTVIYPGSSPKEIEEGVIAPIEERVNTLVGVYQYSSQALENMGTLDIRIDKGFDTQAILQELKNEIDRIPNFPQGMEKPIVSIVKAHTRSVTLSLSGNASIWQLKQYAEIFRNDLLKEKEITQTNIEGFPGRELVIEVQQDLLEKYQVNLSEVEKAFKSNNRDITSGILELPNEELLLRLRGRSQDIYEIENYIIRKNQGAGPLLIKDVAVVQERNTISPKKTFIEGKRSILIGVDKTTSQDILNNVAQVKKVKANFSEKYPELELKILYDATVNLKSRIKLLMKNGLMGFALVLLVLALFLNLRLAFWVALGIPISFAGMFVAMWFFGLTINVISLFGMILVVGILVDDAIVVGENIFQHYEKGASAFQAAVRGAIEMIKPVGMAVLTTIVAFLPFFFLDGGIGKFIWQIAFVVIWSLIVSLIECLLILPAHLAFSKGLQDMRNQKHPWRKAIDNWLHNIIHNYYGRSLKKSMSYPWATITLGLVLLAFSVFIFKSGRIGFSFFPYIDGDRINIDLSFKAGTQEDKTLAWLNTIETAALEVNKSFSAQREDSLEVIRFIHKSLGRNSLGASGSHAGKLTLHLLEGEIRNLRSFEVVNAIKQKVGSIPGVEKISWGGGGRWGKPISINLLGVEPKILKKAQTEIKARLGEHPALTNVMDNAEPGPKEIQFEINTLGYDMGLTNQIIGSQLRTAFFGKELQRFQKGRDEWKVWLRLAEDEKISFGQLDDFLLQNPQGEFVLLKDVVEYTIARGPARIQHMDGKLRVSIEAEMLNPDEPTEPIKKDIDDNIIAEVLAKYDGVSIAYDGQRRSRAKFTDSILPAFLSGLAVILILLILVFRSYFQMIIIFLMIPMGLVGAFVAHILRGEPISFLSLLGLCALMGVIINDSIVYIDTINRNLAKGMLLYKSIYEAGLSRFRPIVLTTLSTGVGMAPLIFEKSLQAKFLIPMALALSGGLFLGSIFILYMVPALFLIINRIKYFWNYLWGYRGSPEGLEVAVLEKDLT
jgi:multidrug efflux pump subunit AcrB